MRSSEWILSFIRWQVNCTFIFLSKSSFLKNHLWCSFELGLLEWFVLQCIITHQRNFALSGCFGSRFFKTPHKFREKQRIGKLLWNLQSRAHGTSEFPQMVTQPKKTTNGSNDTWHIYHFMWPRINLPSFFPCRNFFGEKVLIPLLRSRTEKRNLTFIHRITLGKAQAVKNNNKLYYNSVLWLIITACYYWRNFRQ